MVFARVQLFVLCLLVTPLGTAWSVQTTPKKPRPYALGPLKRSEFVGKVKEDESAQAETKTRVVVRYTFDTQPRQGRFTSRLTTAHVEAVFLPTQSWWRGAEDDRLLDHEQGHFDISEIAARTLQLAFNSLLADRSFSATGHSAKQAERVLTAKIRRLMQQTNEHAIRQHKEYDRLTQHGLRWSTQAEWRRVQQATLLRLKKQLHGPSSERRAR